MSLSWHCVFVRPFFWFAMLSARLPQKWLLRAAKLTCLACWPFLYRRRRVASVNIELCFKELSLSERQDLFNRNLLATITGVFELFRAWYAPSKALAGLADIHGLERLQTAMAEGKGVMLLTGHFTHTELAVRLLNEALNKKVRVVVRRHNIACIEQVFETAREKVFGYTIEKKDLRSLLKTLRAGDAVVYSSDQNFNYQNAFIPFFGIPAATLTATPGIVERSGAKMLPFWFYRDVDGRYQITIAEAWKNWPSLDPIADTRIYMQKLEAVVREHPEQYLWVHRRFKTRPAGSPDIYL
jgi:Kdo2-lipid IVA lauroyltransferase/acyltransferase